MAIVFANCLKGQCSMQTWLLIRDEGKQITLSDKDPVNYTQVPIVETRLLMPPSLEHITDKLHEKWNLFQSVFPFIWYSTMQLTAWQNFQKNLNGMDGLFFKCTSIFFSEPQHGSFKKAKQFKLVWRSNLIIWKLFSSQRSWKP